MKGNYNLHIHITCNNFFCDFFNSLQQILYVLRLIKLVLPHALPINHTITDRCKHRHSTEHASYTWFALCWQHGNRLQPCRNFKRSF
ncbi:hypothetical protein FLA_6198 [Filimonas lacunae]|nr:hypothetical protein FLA_6198 [Filimonas lacunae]